MNLKKMKRKIKRFKELSINSLIYNTYYHQKIDNNLVYVESRDGKDFTGNMLRIIEELSSGDYGKFKVFIYAREDVHPKIKELQKNYNLNIIWKISSKASVATRYMEKAKFLIADSGMRHKYVKRPGQIVLNTWHGTPLKTMGKYNQPEEHRCGNIQQVFFACDYLLYPNDYMKEKMLESYMMEKIYPGTILNEGYPRNSVFFDEIRRENFKKKFNFLNKEIFVYMPTFKGKLLNRKDETQKNIIVDYLNEIDLKLKDNQVLLVKLHVFNQEQIDFTEFKNIIPFPEGYEVYDILNMADCLITDYSSVFFDFANTRRKIILFNYDEEEYMKDRGTYFPLSDLPFPKVQTVDDLIEELNRSKNYDDDEFIEKFCTYDNPDAVKRLCSHIFKGNKVCSEEKIRNDKKNILIFGGGLLNNGITTSLINMLSVVDKDENNYFITYRTWDKYIKRNHVHLFEKIPEGIEFCPLRTKTTPTIYERRVLDKYLASKDFDEKYPKTIKKLFDREFKRSFSDFKFDSIIQFNGYGPYQTLLFDRPESKKAIWVHNNMMEEITKKGKKSQVLKKVYNDFESVCVVSPDLIESTSQISGKKDNIKVVHNINTYNEINEKSLKDIEFDEKSEIITSNPDGIDGILNGEGKLFITIGRFSPEKGHDRLINAFNEFCKDYPDSKLIIIGGYGSSYKSTVKLMENCKYSSNIAIVKWISNPMPILRKSDLFIVSSFYEGWPMVIMEADTLNIPIIATDIIGTQWMKDYNGYVIDNSEEGILQGMYDYMEGKVPNNLGIDYKEYNENAVKEFLEVI